MELRQYFDVVRRRWWLVAAIVGLTVLLSLGLFVLRPATYASVARFAVRVEPTPPTTGEYTFDRYYLWFSSEFLVDDYTLIVPSRAFAEEVVAQMKKANNWNEGNTPEAVAAALQAERKHRVLTVSVESRDPGTAQAIIDGVAAALTEQTVAQSGTPSLDPRTVIQDQGMFALLDKTDQAGQNGGRQLVNAVVTVLVGLVLALALAFLLEFLDNSLRDPADAERVLGLRVMGAIPAHK